MSATATPPRTGERPAEPRAPAGTRVALRHRLAERGIDRQLLLLVPAALFVLVLFIYPFAYGVGLSFQPTQGGPFAAYQEFFSDPYQRDTIWTTLKLSLPAALLNVAASVPIAYRMRGRFRGSGCSPPYWWCRSPSARCSPRRGCSTSSAPPAGSTGSC
ncbi:hypothetical protein [Plantactinospora veratri]